MQSGSAHYDRGGSWILPSAKKSDLLYISDLLAQVVDIYTYGHGYKLVGELTGFFNPEGLCVDKKGNVYVTNDTSLGVYQITEYAHGSTSPTRTLNDPDGRANGCSVDPTTGNLAVADFWGPSEIIGNVAVFPKANGPPTSYSNSNIFYDYYCGYDDNGNLFVDGETEGSVFGLGELAKGAIAASVRLVSEIALISRSMPRRLPRGGPVTVIPPLLHATSQPIAGSTSVAKRTSP